MQPPDATTYLDQAESLWTKWNSQREAWLQQYASHASLTDTLQTLPDDSPQIQSLRARLQTLAQQSPDLDSPAQFEEQLTQINTQVNRYNTLQQQGAQLAALRQHVAPSGVTEASAMIKDHRGFLDNLDLADDSAWNTAQQNIEAELHRLQADTAQKESPKPVERETPASPSGKFPSTPPAHEQVPVTAKITTSFPEQPPDTPLAGDQTAVAAEIAAPTALDQPPPTTADVSPTPPTQPPSTPPTSEPGSVTSQVSTPAPVPATLSPVVSAPPVTIFLNAPPEPPKSDDKITLEVNLNAVVLNFGGRRFQSPNRLDHARLENEVDYKTEARTYGELLFKGLINEEGSPGFKRSPTRTGYEAAMERTRGKIRIELRVDPTHPVYKWEYLRSPNDDLPRAAYERSPFYRLHSNYNGELAPARPLKILFAICSPTDLGKATGPAGESVPPVIRELFPLDIELERQIIIKSVQPLAGLVQADILVGSETGPVTLEAVQEKLQEGYHVLHLLAHGVYFKANKKYALVMEDSNRRFKYVYADDFDQAMFANGLRLMVLAACQSGNTELGDNLQALGPRLVENDLPAVIAMQDNLPLAAAQIFTQRFYGDLARSGRIDMALASTRHDLYLHDKPGYSWGIPVLWMSTSENQLINEGKLFDVDEQAAQQIKRPTLDEMKLQGFDELGGLGDPAPRRLAQALENQVRLHGYGQDTSLISALRAVAAPNLVSRPPEPEPLAPKQDRAGLSALAARVDIRAAQLQQYVHAHSGLKSAQSTFAQIASALNSGKHLILIGPPGTGKTSLAQDICSFARQANCTTGVVLATATADWTTFDTVGGYIPTREQVLQFRPGVFLEAIINGKWLVIDEINRAEIDKAFGELFTVLSGQQVDLPYQVGRETVRVRPPAKPPAGAPPNPRGWVPAGDLSGYDYVIHPNWRIIGTMNVYDKSTLFQMSFAFMRRFAFVDVDLPPDAVHFDLVDRWLMENGLPVAAAAAGQVLTFKDLTLLQQKFRLLLDRQMVAELKDYQLENPLMARRALGPAIVKDMIEYIGDRNRQNQGMESLTSLLGEAFLLYVVAQLDGLDLDGIRKIYQHMRALFNSIDPNDLELILSRIRLLYPHIPKEEWDK